MAQLSTDLPVDVLRDDLHAEVLIAVCAPRRRGFATTDAASLVSLFGRALPSWNVPQRGG